MINYKVCVLAAGVGSRIGAISENVNKSILPVNFKATISYIVEKFPENIEIVIAIGHKKEIVKDYLALAHPERKFNFVEVDRYLGPGTGPGHSLLQCKDQLQCPFILSSADTIVLEDVKPPTENWLGIAPVKQPKNYCTVKIRNNLICQIDDKVDVDNKFAFIGLAGIREYKIFFEALERDRQVVSGEIQVSNGFKKLLEQKLVPIGFTWFDTGTIDKYLETNKHFSGGDKVFDMSKGDEFLYFVGDRVIKFFADANITKKKHERSKQLQGLIPEIEAYKNNFFSYKKVPGHTLYEVLNQRILKDFLKWSKDVLWKEQELTKRESEEFRDACKKFYYDKTLKRLENFLSKHNIEDTENSINGVTVPPLKDLLNEINWDNIYSGVPVRFHGDYKFGNVLVTRDSKSQLQKFTLIDWRHEFGGLMHVGDLYYDLGKLYAGLILSEVIIKNQMFSFDMSGSSVYYNYFLKSDLLEALEEYESFLKKNNLDVEKVKTIAGLSFVNIASLHNYPFSFLSFYLGKNILHKVTQNKVGKIE